MKKSFPLSQVYGLLEPGPVVLVTTAQKGRANVMTLSWLTMMDFEPPLVGMVMSDRTLLPYAALGEWVFRAVAVLRPSWPRACSSRWG